ncbi:MAG: hypothetical protein ACK4PN_12735 [Allorhizobium sp.]
MTITRVPSALFADVSGRKFDNLSAASSFSPAVAPLYVETAGYTSPGDGGSAVYRKVVSEPSHAAKFQITLSDGFTPAWYELADQETNSKMFGGNIAAACAFQRTRGGRVRVPYGTHNVATQILLDYATQTGDVHVDPRGVYLTGDGLHNTLLANELTGAAISIVGDDAVASGAGALIYAGVEDLSITGTGRGLRMSEIAFSTCKNLMFRDLSVAMDLISVLSSTFDRIMITGGTNGVQVFKGSGFSDHNANKWTDCEFRLGTGVAFSGGPSSGLWFKNPAIQGWGVHGNAATGGMDLNFTGSEGGVGLTIDSGYFEFNRGGFDIRLTNDGPNHVVHKISGVNFVRLGASQFVTHNIIASGAGAQTIVLDGCQFGGRSGYVPDAGRTYVSKTENVTVFCVGCRFDSPTEQGSAVNIS